MVSSVKMSFYDGTFSQDSAIEIVKRLGDSIPIYYTYGLKYRNPAICDQEIPPNKAIEILSDSGRLIDFEVFVGYIDINEYSSNDLF